jgi:hypothetical protein
VDSSKRGKIKLLAAVCGCAVVIMGALTTTASGKPDTVEATSMAVPSIKGPAPLPKEEEGAE